MLLKTENGKTVQVQDTSERRFPDADRAAMSRVLYDGGCLLALLLAYSIVGYPT